MQKVIIHSAQGFISQGSNPLQALLLKPSIFKLSAETRTFVKNRRQC